MAHHQHHGHVHFTQNSLSASPQPMSQNMPSISEDEHSGEADEPPDHPLRSFHKSLPPNQARRPSLLTKALHTDSESHDESLGFSSAFKRQTSRSSTCSTWSLRTDHTSDDMHLSNPSSPSKSLTFQMPATDSLHGNKSASQQCLDSRSAHAVSPEETLEPVIEEKLGRKRCITFACGRQNAQESKPRSKSPEAPNSEAKASTPPKRPCALKFVCPSKVSSTRQEAVRRTSRHLSPPPPLRAKPASPNPPSLRSHRDSDVTVMNDSPKTARKVPPMEPRKPASTEELEEDNSEATRFHEFASSDGIPEDWVQESTCHRSRLTVDDTLEKEKTIRQIGEEAEEEALQEEEAEDDALSGANDSDDDISDEGFQTDDEEGFAESDDESDNGSDYEWWAPNRSSPAEATMAPGDAFRLPAMHNGSVSSLSSVVSPAQREECLPLVKSKRKPKTKAIPIRPASPELPDSTDFVCGTLDEDKPLEEAYKSCIELRRAAKRRPQDVDPTLPDEPMGPDEDEDDSPDADAGAREYESENLFHGAMESVDNSDEEEEEPRGRLRDPQPKLSAESSRQRLQSNTPRTASIKRVKSPMPGSKQVLKRPKSPMPTSTVPTSASKSNPKKGQRLRSPAPRALFGHSPKHARSPPPPTTLKSPPPSRKSSPSGAQPMPFGTAFLGQRPQLTHTTSLPRSPNPFAYKRAPFVPLSPQTVEVSDADEGEDTAKESKSGYTRGAVDIVQGLERKRLRRRQKFYEKYCRKEEKKRERGEVKRPPPGKGAQRMKQVGIECAVYRGKRVLSI